jgi:hypothetical protein
MTVEGLGDWSRFWIWAGYNVVLKAIILRPSITAEA